MLRISDIFKKYKEEKKKAEAADAGPGRQDVSGGVDAGLDSAQGQEASKNAKSCNKVSIASAVHKELDKIISTNIGELYESGVSAAKKLYDPNIQYQEGLMAALGACVERITDLLSAGNKDLLRLSLADYLKPEEYLYCHIVNVCVISIEMGFGFGYDRSRLLDLGKAAFLHDVGLSKYLSIINKAGTLDKEELHKIQDHPNVGADMLNAFSKELAHTVFEVVRQEHERMDGSGYPQGLKDTQITEFARIVGLADVYEAMIHARPYRAKFTPLETIKTILGSKSAFDQKAVKSLIEGIGIFPMGTLVKLNTNEIGIVLKENPDLPLRPTVKILCDAYGKETKEPKQINLSDNSMIYIEECIKG